MLRRQTVSTVFKRFNHRFNYEANPEKAAAFKKLYEATEHHAAGTTKLWKNISLATIPVLAVCAYYVYGKESHHIAHRHAVMAAPEEDWPREMEYQNIRNKKFYFGDGDKTLFWSWANHKGAKE